VNEASSTATSNNIERRSVAQHARAILSGRLARNMGWLGSAQLVGRVFRLATTIVVARTLTPEIFGLAAIVFSSYELMQVFTRRATGSKLIQIDAERLAAATETAYWLNWLLCLAACLVTVVAAWPIAWLYGDERLWLPIVTIASGFLLLPMGMIPAALNLRNCNLRVVARAEILQILVDAALTVVLVLAGWGLWALVLPKVVVIPLWVWVHRAATPWQPPRRVAFAGWRELTAFGRNVVASDLLAVLRQHIDYLLVGYFLGLQALGVYFFAFNAGLGLSLGVLNAFSTSLYPHLCAARGDVPTLRERLREGIITASLIAVPVIALQSALAPWYLPFIYGEQWVSAGAVPLLILLCLSALTRPLGEAAAQLLLAVGRSGDVLRWSAAFTVILALALVAGTRWGLIGVANAVLVCHLVVLPLYLRWTAREVLSRPPSSPAVPVLVRG
jgi:PST family polysaccharide transporter